MPLKFQDQQHLSSIMGTRKSEAAKPLNTALNTYVRANPEATPSTLYSRLNTMKDAALGSAFTPSEWNDLIVAHWAVSFMQQVNSHMFNLQHD